MPVFILIAIFAMIGLRYGVGTPLFSPSPSPHPSILLECFDDYFFSDFWQRKSKKSFLLVSFFGLWLFPFFW
jgi:hypothetical protein